jgi:hypothetical protein
MAIAARECHHLGERVSGAVREPPDTSRPGLELFMCRLLRTRSGPVTESCRRRAHRKRTAGRGSRWAAGR